MPSSGVQTCADRKSTRLNSSHTIISYAVFCLKKKKKVARLQSSQHRDPQSRLRERPRVYASAVAALRCLDGDAVVLRLAHVVIFFFLNDPATPKFSPLPPPPPFPF